MPSNSGLMLHGKISDLTLISFSMNKRPEKYKDNCNFYSFLFTGLNNCELFKHFLFTGKNKILKIFGM